MHHEISPPKVVNQIRDITQLVQPASSTESLHHGAQRPAQAELDKSRQHSRSRCTNLRSGPSTHSVNAVWARFYAKGLHMCLIQNPNLRLIPHPNLPTTKRIRAWLQREEHHPWIALLKRVVLHRSPPKTRRQQKPAKQKVLQAIESVLEKLDPRSVAVLACCLRSHCAVSIAP